MRPIRLLGVVLLAALLTATPSQATGVQDDRPGYRDLSSAQAVELIRTSDPLILDVRTKWEFRMGRLANAVLIPVGELRDRLNELSAHKERDVLIYCATGGRSVSAANFLTANGFDRVYNLKRGIYGWARQRHPVVR